MYSVLAVRPLNVAVPVPLDEGVAADPFNVYVLVTPVPEPPDQETVKAELVILLDARPVMAVGADGGGPII